MSVSPLVSDPRQGRIAESWLVDIVERASTIAERLGNGFVRDEAGTGAAKIDTRIEEWCHNVAGGDWEQFRRYLSWDGYEPETIRPALGRVHLRQGAAIPGWADTLRDTLELAASMREHGAAPPWPRDERFLQPEQPLPFEEVLAPFVHVARQRLATDAAGGYEL